MTCTCILVYFLLRFLDNHWLESHGRFAPDSTNPPVTNKSACPLFERVCLAFQPQHFGHFQRWSVIGASRIWDYDSHLFAWHIRHIIAERPTDQNISNPHVMILKIYHDAICQPSPLAFATVNQLGFPHAVIQQPQAFFYQSSLALRCRCRFLLGIPTTRAGEETTRPKEGKCKSFFPVGVVGAWRKSGRRSPVFQDVCDKTSKKCGKSLKRKCDSLTTYYILFWRQHRGFKVCVAQYLVKIDQSKFCSNGFKDSIRCVFWFFPKKWWPSSPFWALHGWVPGVSPRISRMAARTLGFGRLGHPQGARHNWPVLAVTDLRMSDSC